MIAKGNFHAAGVRLAAYLVKAHPGERGELIDMRGFGPISDLRDGFRIEQIRARDGTRAEKPFFHVHLRGAAGEGLQLSRETWKEIADRCDLALGMPDQPRATSLHIDRKTGDMHMHIGYSLVRENEDGQLHVQKLGLFKNKLKGLAREIERDYGLKILSNERQPDDRARAAGRDEFEEARRLGTDLKATRSAILDCFEKSDNGKALKAALEDRGLMLAQGDRRDCFVVIDAAGGQHALNKKLTGLTLAETRGRLGDLDRMALPGVEQAKTLQAQRQAAHEAEQEQRRAATGRRDDIRAEGAAAPAQEREKHGRATEGVGQGNTLSESPQRDPDPRLRGGEIKPLGKTAGEIRLAWQLTKTAEQFAEAIEDRGLILVHVSREEAEESSRRAAFAKAIGRQNRALKESFAVVDQRGNVTRIDQRTTGDHLEEIEKRLAGIDRRELVSVADAREAMRDANRTEWREQQQERRDALRAATRLEEKIAECQRVAQLGVIVEHEGEGTIVHGPHAFAAALGDAGIAITRVTETDVIALATLRQDEADTREMTNGVQARRAQHFATLQVGDIAAVDRFGNVHRLNPKRLNLDQLAASVTEANGQHLGRLLSVTEARASFEIGREEWAIRREETAEAWRMDRAEKALARGDGAVGPESEPDALRSAGGTSGALADGGVKILSSAMDFLADMIAPAPPPTKDQAERMGRAAEERQAEKIARQMADEEKRLRDILDQIKRSDERREREARERQQQYDDRERGRER